MTRRPRTLLAAAAVAAALPLAAPAGAPAPAAAQELTAEAIIAELEELSRAAEANSEAVTALDIEVEEQERLVTEQGERVAAATRAAETARDRAADTRTRLAGYVRQRLRGATTDPVTAVLGAADAQDAIDRTAYLARLGREQDEVLAGAAERLRAAADAHARAASAAAEARFTLNQLEARRGELDAERAELDRRTGEVRDRVSALSPEQLAIWRAKNNPVTEGLAALLGSSAAVDAAMSKIGAPYSWGAAGPDAFDCSGLMYWAYAQIGKSIPRTSQAQLAGGTPVSRDQLQPGDIIGYYPGVTHVGMYVGNGQIVHASDYGIPVQVVSIDQGGPYQGAVRY